jgi:hypothetical protein
LRQGCLQASGAGRGGHICHVGSMGCLRRPANTTLSIGFHRRRHKLTAK